MGFNNRGQPDAFARLIECSHMHGVIGVNVGANKDSSDRIADYVAGVRAMAPVAEYLTINISSPNTPGLRGLQDEGALQELLAAVQDAGVGQADLPEGRARSRRRRPRADRPRRDRPQDRCAHRLEHDRVAAAAQVALTQAKAGGLSGAPLKSLALEALRKFRARERGRNPADRGRRDRIGGRRVGADPRRGEPRPALQRDGL